MKKHTAGFTLTRRALGAVAALSLMLPFAGSAYAQTTMKLASATINDVQHEWQKEFQKEMEARVGDEVTVEIYPASQLGAIPRMAEGVLLGTIEAFTTPTSFVTNVDPRFQAFDVPGLFEDADEVDAVIHDKDFRDYMETLFLDKGVRIIGAIFNSPTQILTREPVTTLDGFKGLKVRTFASPLQMEPMTALGVNPTPLALSEVTPQLQAGGIDGMLAGIPILTAFKFYDTAKHVTNIKHEPDRLGDARQRSLVPVSVRRGQDGNHRGGQGGRGNSVPLGRGERRTRREGMAGEWRRGPHALRRPAGRTSGYLRKGPPMKCSPTRLKFSRSRTASFQSSRRFAANDPVSRPSQCSSILRHRLRGRRSAASLPSCRRQAAG